MERWAEYPKSTELIKESSLWLAIESQLDPGEVQLATGTGWYLSRKAGGSQRLRFFATDLALYCCPLMRSDHFDVRPQAGDLILPYSEIFVFDPISEKFDFELIVSVTGRPVDARRFHLQFDTSVEGTSFVGTLIQALKRHGGGRLREG